MCVTLYLSYLNNDAIQYNLVAHVIKINFHRLCRILHTCYDVIVTVKNEMAQLVNVIENVDVF